MPLRFTIRDLLWLTVVVALGVGWWIDRRTFQRQLSVERSEAASEYNSLRQSLIDAINAVSNARGPTSSGTAIIPGISMSKEPQVFKVPPPKVP